MPTPDDRETQEALAAELRSQRLDDQRRMEAERIALAEQRADERARVESRLTSLETNLARTTGSVDDRLERIDVKVERLQNSFQRVERQQGERDAATQAQASAIEKAGEKMISARQFWLGLAAVIVSVAALFLSQQHPNAPSVTTVTTPAPITRTTP